MRSNKKEPLIHIVKRGSIRWYHAMAFRGAALVLALLACALLIKLLTFALNKAETSLRKSDIR